MKMATKGPGPITTNEIAADDLDRSIRNYKLYKEIGHGSFSRVFIAQNELSGQMVALKEIAFTDGERFSWLIMREIGLLQQLQHENIVKLMDAFVESSRIYMICEAAEHDLRRVLNRRKVIDEQQNQLYLRQIFSGVAFCHSHSILHRDLKPENILVFPNHVVKIADFGLGKALSVRRQIASPGAVTLWYRSMELLLHSSHHTFALDCWSLGCLVAEMVLGYVIFNAKNETKQIELIVDKLGVPDKDELLEMQGEHTFFEFRNDTDKSCLKREAFLQRFAQNPKAGDLVLKLLAYKPSQRLLVSDALKHAYFNL
jgi:serine/threonine protein kinase